MRPAPRFALGVALASLSCSHPAPPAAPDASVARPDVATVSAHPGAPDSGAHPDVSTVVEGPTGSIEGNVFLDGPLHAGPRLTVPTAFASHAGCRDAAVRYAQPFDVTTPGAMPGALVTAEAHTTAPPLGRERTLVFRDCDITPRVLFATETDRIVFHAESQLPHLPHIFGYDAQIDQVLIPHQDDQTHPFTHPGRYPVGARTMPDWAQSFLFILPNRYIATADAAGHYAITDVPVGRVLVHAWYPGTAPAQVIVDVQAGVAAHADFHIHQLPEGTHAPVDAGGVPTPG